jgi:monoterpene epsilon-lactone hydrolase
MALLTTLRDAREPLPSAAVLMSPVSDLTASGASMTERDGEDPIFTPEMIRGIEAAHLAGADPKSSLASPLSADLKGLPPLLVLVGTAELLFSDSERLAAAARDSGVDVTVQVGEGLPHVYPIMLGTPEAATATEESVGSSATAFCESATPRHG